MTEQETKAVLALFGLEKLEDATRENWPWWTRHHVRYKREKASDSAGTYAVAAYVPDFPKNPAASVRLAEQAAQQLEGIVVIPPRRSGQEWSAENLNGKPLAFARTLGGCVVAAAVGRLQLANVSTIYKKQ